MSIINWNERKLAKLLYEAKFYNNKQSLNEAKHILKTCDGLDLTYQAVKYAKTNADGWGKVTPTTIYAACKDIGDEELLNLVNNYEHVERKKIPKDLKIWQSNEKKIYQALKDDDFDILDKILLNVKNGKLDFDAKVDSYSISMYNYEFTLIDEILKNNKLLNILFLFDKHDIKFDGARMSSKKLDIGSGSKERTITPLQYSFINRRMIESSIILMDRHLKNKRKLSIVLNEAIDSNNKEAFNYLFDKMEKDRELTLSQADLMISLVKALTLDNGYVASRLLMRGEDFNPLVDQLKEDGLLKEAIRLEKLLCYIDKEILPVESLESEVKAEQETESKYTKEKDNVVSISEELEDTGETLKTVFNFKSEMVRYVIDNKTQGMQEFKEYKDEEVIVEASKFLQDNGGDITDWSALNSKKTAVSKVVIMDLKNKGCN